MSVQQRIRLCLLLEKMYERKEFSEQLGLEDKTKFHGQNVRKTEETHIC